MLEYFTIKKLKRHRASGQGKEEGKEDEDPVPVLSPEDEHFLHRIVSEEGTPPPLPERPSTANSAISGVGDSAHDDVLKAAHDEPGTKTRDVSDASETHSKDKGKEGESVLDKGKKLYRLSFLGRSMKGKTDTDRKENATQQEVSKEDDDIRHILDKLNLAAVDNRAFSLSEESQKIVQKFTVVLKDLVNGVPTAYDDLVNLFEDSNATLTKTYEHLPHFLQKLISNLPQKLTTTLAPELLAVATEVQSLSPADAAKPATTAGLAGLGGAAKKYLSMTSLKDLVTKPGALVGMLKAIVNVLKSRFPALIGTNVLLSVSLFVLLFALWYCHKRGKEVRLEKEAKVAKENDTLIEDDHVQGSLSVKSEPIGSKHGLKNRPSREETNAQEAISIKSEPSELKHSLNSDSPRKETSQKSPSPSKSPVSEDRSEIRPKTSNSGSK